MADTANAAGGLTVSQSTDDYKMWNTPDWFDTQRWTLTGTQPDSDWKAGLWWMDGLAFEKISPVLHQFADDWTTEINKLKDMKTAVDKASDSFAQNKGVNAARTTSALADISKAVAQKLDDLAPLPAAMHNAAAIIERNTPGIASYWNKWENDRNNFEACHQDVVATQPLVTNCANACLQAADAIQKAFQNNLNAPNITVPPNTNGNSSLSASTLKQLNSGPSAMPTQVAATQTTADKTPGVVAAAAAPHAAAGTATSPSAANGHGTTAGTVVGATNGTATSKDPTLAGSGFGSNFAAPAAAPAGGLSGGGGFSGGGVGSMPAAAAPAAAGPVGGGFAPTGFVGGMPGSFGGSGTSTSKSTPKGSGTPLFPVSPGDDDSTGDGLGGRNVRPGGAGAQALIGGAVPGQSVGGRRGAEIRPGYANKPRTSGVAEGLLGRAAKDSEFSEVIGSTRRRRPNRRRDDKGRETVQFLDEEAWLTDDPGSGVVRAEEQPSHENTARPTFGTPSLG